MHIATRAADWCVRPRSTLIMKFIGTAGTQHGTVLQGQERHTEDNNPQSCSGPVTLVIGAKATPQ